MKHKKFVGQKPAENQRLMLLQAVFAYAFLLKISYNPKTISFLTLQ
jgi:hypothetical protein